MDRLARNPSLREALRASRSIVLPLPKNLTYSFNSHTGTVSVSPQLTSRRMFAASDTPATTVISSTPTG
jgi:hypothetical protein